MGGLPGCLGAFAMVSLYSHRRVTVGAIVTTMIATSGDEAFVMLAMFPKTALLLFVALAVLGIVAGRVTDLAYGRKAFETAAKSCEFKTHTHEWRGALTPRGRFVAQWRSPSAVRGVLTVAIGLFLVALIAYRTGFIQHGEEPEGAHAETTAESVEGDAHDHEDIDEDHAEDEAGHSHVHGDWMWVTLAVLTLFGLFIVATVSDHFLDEHLWRHVLKVHVPRIFLWTLGALAAIAVLEHFIDVHAVVQDNVWIVLLMAVLIGLIPDSGPHLIFVSLFAAGALPLSILVASSIVQDGHGMVPLLAHSRKDFIQVKANQRADRSGGGRGHARGGPLRASDPKIP